MLQWLLTAASSCSAGAAATDVVAGLTHAAPCGLTMADHFDGRFQLGPLPLGVQVVQAVRCGNYPAFPPLDSAMSLVHSLGVVIGHPVKARCLGLLEPVADAIVELTLILLHRQHIVSPAVCDLLGNLPLAAHGPIWSRVDGNDAAVQVQHFQQLGNGGDFIGLLLGPDPGSKPAPYYDTGCMAPLPPHGRENAGPSCRQWRPPPRAATQRWPGSRP